VFQQLEVDYTVGRPRPDVWPTAASQVPVVRMFGVNDAGERRAPAAGPLRRRRAALRRAAALHRARPQRAGGGRGRAACERRSGAGARGAAPRPHG
jgi:hypothetical protein